MSKVWKVETSVKVHWFKTFGAACRFAGKNTHWHVKEGSESEACWFLTKHTGCQHLDIQDAHIYETNP